jgi:hypothetical protein
MVILVFVETLVVLLLALLVGGLLRSHAEILRRLEGMASDNASLLRPSGHSPPAVPASPRREPGPAPDIAGRTLRGEPVKVTVSGHGGTILAFMSSGCSSCSGFWQAFEADRGDPLPGGARLVVVTRDDSMESPSRLEALAPPEIPLVMSSAAWEAYQVPMTPYFVHVEGSSGTIAGEGRAETWAQVLSLLGDAVRDRAGRPEGGGGGAARQSRVDSELELAGIRAGHPSLYESGDPSIE